MRSRPAEENQSLWILAAAPAIWCAHFLTCYATAALWCASWAGPGRSLQGARTAMMVYTVAALVGIAIAGWRGWRRHSLGGQSAPHDLDTHEDRHRFLGLTALLLALLSGVGVAFVALPAVLIRSCY